MSRLARYWLSKPLLSGVLLAALVLRALVPAGFMPAGDGAPFAFEICPVGFPAQLLHQAGTSHEGHGDHGTDPSSSPHPSSFETCPFGSAPAAAPISELPAAAALFVSAQGPETLFSSVFIPSQRFRIQQPRAPPALA